MSAGIHAVQRKTLPHPGSVVAELGCGSAAKTSILLNALLARDGPARTRFAGIDVSGSFLTAAKESLLASCAGLRPANVDLVCAEYIEGDALRSAQPAGDPQAVAGCLLNIHPAECPDFVSCLMTTAWAFARLRSQDWHC